MNLSLIPTLATMQAGGSPMIMNFLVMGGMIAIFYFLMIRPQNKARKALEEKLSKLKSGDEVLLGCGLYATIDRVEDKDIFLKIGSSLVRARRQAVVALANEPVQEQK